MSELPDGWTRARVSDVAETALGKMLDKAKHTRGTALPYLRNQNVRWGMVETHDVHRMNFEDDELVRYGLRAGDVLVCEGGEPGRAAIWDASVPDMKYQKALHRVRPCGALEAAWLVHHLRHDAESAVLSEAFSGTTIKHFTGTALDAYEILVPPLAEQRRIVAKLEDLLARSRRAKAALDAVPALLEKLRQSVLAAAFRGDLTADWRAKNPDVELASGAVERNALAAHRSSGRAAAGTVRPGTCAISVGHPETPVPRGWSWTPLSAVARMESGHTPSRAVAEYWGGAVAWVSIPDARDHNGQEIRATTSTITEAGLANSAARILPAGTVCLVRTAASIGYVTILGHEMATSQDFANWVCGGAILPKYLMYALWAERSALRSFGEGSAHPTIYFPELKAFHVKLAPLPEQQVIVDIVERHLAALARLRDHVGQLCEKRAQLEPAILAKAFRGELVPQDPNDEPAEVMLARLKAQAGEEDGVAPRRRGRTG